MHYYMQLSKPTLRINVRQAELIGRHCLLECYEEYDEHFIEMFNLRYLGVGWRNDRHIVDKVELYR